MTATDPHIPLEAVESSSLAAAGYDADTQTLAVQFKSGDIFHYPGVSMELATAFYGAESRGTFYAQHIRGKFNGRRMTGICPKCHARGGWIGEQCTDCGCADVAPLITGQQLKAQQQDTEITL